MAEYLLSNLLLKLSFLSFKFTGNSEQKIKHITWDYTKVIEQTIYFCLEEEEFQEPYIHQNSLNYWPEAIQNGAVVLVARSNRIKNHPSYIALLEVENVNLTMAWVAHFFYDNPFAKMKMIGITGTNGKTTTSQLIDTILNEQQIKTGVIGTIGIFYPQHNESANHLSNPLATELYAIGNKMKQEETETMIMEITSHGMAFQRTSSLDFDIGIFTNLTQDHLDYHKTIENYKTAKLAHFERLGAQDKTAFAIINHDDSAAHDFINVIPKERRELEKVKILTYAIKNKTADITADIIEMNNHYSLINLFQNQNLIGKLKLPIPGIFNVYNALASFTAGLCLNLAPGEIILALEKAGQVKGRFEKVSTPDKKNIYIDYAHTPDALENILKSVRLITAGQLIVIFGCGGDRDSAKRPLMGKIAHDLADICIITSDNPRNENPDQIIQNIMAGIPLLNSSSTVFAEKDRKIAIYKGLKLLKENDTLLIAGKGHETYQIIGTEKTPFSDRVIVQEFYQKK